MLALLFVVAAQPPVAPAPRVVDPFANWEKAIALIEQTRQNWPFLRDRRIDAYGGLTHRLLTP